MFVLTAGLCTVVKLLKEEHQRRLKLSLLNSSLIISHCILQPPYTSPLENCLQNNWVYIDATSVEMSLLQKFTWPGYMTLTFDLWPWKPCHMMNICAKFHWYIPPLYTASRKTGLGVDGRTDDPNT